MTTGTPSASSTTSRSQANSPRRSPSSAASSRWTRANPWTSTVTANWRERAHRRRVREAGSVNQGSSAGTTLQRGGRASQDSAGEGIADRVGAGAPSYPLAGAARDARSLGKRRSGSAHAEQFHLEHQGGVGRDHTARTPGAITQLRRDGELAAATDLHALHPLVPARDDVAHAQGEGKRVAAVLAGIELGAVGQPAGVMHRDLLAGHGFGAAAHFQFFDDEAARRGGGSH